MCRMERESASQPKGATPGEPPHQTLFSDLLGACAEIIPDLTPYSLRILWIASAVVCQAKHVRLPPFESQLGDSISSRWSKAFLSRAPAGGLFKEVWQRSAAFLLLFKGRGRSTPAVAVGTLLPLNIPAKKRSPHVHGVECLFVVVLPDEFFFETYEQVQCDMQCDVGARVTRITGQQQKTWMHGPNQVTE